ncbi:MAG TPA: 30S ribosomal protein S2 [Acidimicrobiales bacterium]|nr:30S ribosomal protein S2 [Acidimicrobiales bacterium]
MAVVTMKQLLSAGVHFGHQTRRWNPKMRRFILGERNGIYLVDLQQTMKGIEEAYTYTRDLVAGGGSILFVGTKKQTQGPIAAYADACGMPYVNERWLGGMLTNFQTVSTRVKRMKEFEAMEKAGDFDAMPKKEALRHTRELEKLQRNLGGIRGLTKLPDAIFVIDTNKEHIAVTEANKLGLPIVAVVDTNCDPDVIQYVIPGNDDAIRSGALLCRVIADAVVEGRFIAEQRPAPKPPAPPAPAAAPAAAAPAPAVAEAPAEAPAAAEAPAESPAAPAESPAPTTGARIPPPPAPSPAASAPATPAAPAEAPAPAEAKTEAPAPAATAEAKTEAPAPAEAPAPVETPAQAEAEAATPAEVATTESAPAPAPAPAPEPATATEES